MYLRIKRDILGEIFNKKLSVSAKNSIWFHRTPFSVKYQKTSKIRSFSLNKFFPPEDRFGID